MAIFMDCRIKSKKVSDYLAASMSGDNMARLFKTLLDVFLPIRDVPSTVGSLLLCILTYTFVQASSTPASLPSTSFNSSTVSVSRAHSSLLLFDSDDDEVGDDGARARSSVERAAAIAHVRS